MSILYFTLCALNSVILIANGRIEYAKGSPFCLFWIGFFFNYFIYTLFDFGNYTFQATSRTAVVSIDPDTLVTVQFFIFIFNALFFIYLSFSKTEFTQLSQINYTARLPDYLPLIVIIIFLGRMLFRVYSGDQAQDFSELRANSSVTGLLLDTYFKYIFVGVVVYYFTISRYFISLFLLGLLFLDFVFFGGGRQFFLLAIIGLVSAILIVKRYSFITCFLTFSLMPIGIFIAKVLVFLRNLNGYQERLDFIASFDWGIIKKSTTNEYDLRFAFYHFIGNQNDLPETFFSLNYFIRILYFWLPSSLSFGLKPEDFEYDMYSFYTGEFDGSLHATFYGTIFADSGWFILPWLLLLFFVREMGARINFKTSHAANIVYWFSLVYLSTMWARGSIYAPIVVNIFILIVLYLLTKPQKMMTLSRVQNTPI